jgi:serine protease Do
VLEKIDGVQQDDSRAFMRSVVMMSVGTPVHLTVWRDGREQEITATVAEWPNYMMGGGMLGSKMAEAMIAKEPDPGLRLSPITDEARKQYGIDPKLTGVLVSSVEQDCEARDLGIVAGDVVVAVQGGLVSTPEDIRLAVRAAHQEHRPFLAVLIQAKAVARWVSLSIDSPGS